MSGRNGWVTRRSLNVSVWLCCVSIMECKHACQTRLFARGLLDEDRGPCGRRSLCQIRNGFYDVLGGVGLGS
jgi:hypothetical protein